MGFALSRFPYDGASGGDRQQVAGAPAAVPLIRRALASLPALRDTTGAAPGAGCERACRACLIIAAMKDSRPPSVTIQEVAELAQVSSKTVSRVLNDEPAVREGTRNRILKAIEKLDYRPNLNARGLAGDRSFLIGLFCDKPGDYLSEFQAGAVQRCRESDFHLMVEPWDSGSPDVGRQVSTLLRQLRLEGVIILPLISDHPLNRASLDESRIRTLRHASNNDPEDAPWVGIDDRAPVRR